jgi:hypothetical protein
MIKQFLLSQLIILSSLSMFSQEIIQINKNASCSYFGEFRSDEAYTFASTNEAQGILNAICGSVGLKPNFIIKSANVPNASALIDSATKQRLILYSQTFISSIDLKTKTNWGSISILAHEIGHHLNGHTLIGYTTDRRKNHMEELQADEFSGFVCFKLGSTLEQAQSAMQTFADNENSTTHPPKSARLEAISVGWNKAKEQVIKTDNQSPTTNKPTEQTVPNIPTSDNCQTLVKFINKVGWSLLMFIDGNNVTLAVNQEVEVDVTPNKILKYRVTTSDNSMWTEGPYTLNIYGTVNVKECTTKTVTLNDPKNEKQKMPDWKGW